MLWTAVQKMKNTITNKWVDLQVFKNKKEVIRKRRTQGRSIPIISITKAGVFSFSPAFNKKAKMEKYTHVALSYSKINNGIVIDLLPERIEDKCFKITPLVSGYKVITCRTFLKHFGIDYSVVKAYKPTFEKFTDGKYRWVMLLSE